MHEGDNVYGRAVSKNVGPTVVQFELGITYD